MNKNKKMNGSTKAILARIDEIKREIGAMADKCHTEQRERNEQEESRYKALCRDLSYYEMKLQASGSETQREESPWTQFREMLTAGQQFKVFFREEAEGAGAAGATASGMSTADFTGTDGQINPIVPLTVGEIIKPLEEGTIIGKLGMRMPTGLRGRYESTVVGTVECTVEDEGAETEDSTIDLDSISADNQRISAKVSVSRQALFQSDYKLEAIIKEQLIKGLVRIVNKIMLAPDLFNAKTRIKGPFVDLKAKATTLTAFGNKTFKELNLMKAGLLGLGLTSERMCFVMTEATKAELEATPKDAGSGIMVIENDRLCGLPVFCSHFIGNDYIGLGDWIYQLCGLFDQISMIVDPYTLAGKDQVRFIINANYGTATYRPDAFALAKVTR
ncbi:MAG: phage major capsid protein [Muribaculaceae bacterium]|nr:phage major capsid protein [Muribaculaceae bacterium]